MAEKERESRQMHEEAVRVGNHTDKLKMIRARNLQKIEKKQVHIRGCSFDKQHRERHIDENKQRLEALKGSKMSELLSH